MEPLFLTLADFFRGLNMPQEPGTELTVHRLDGMHGEGPFQSPSFRTNYHAFLLLTGGQNQYTIDGHTFELGRGSFYFTNPGHLKSFLMRIPMTGYILTFTPVFAGEQQLGDLAGQFPFLVHATTPPVVLEPEAYNDMTGLFEQMLREYERPSAYRDTVLAHQLMILLLKTKALIAAQPATLPPPRRADEWAGLFKKHVNENFRQLASGHTDKVLSVKEHADHLNLHPNYLTNLIRQQTGKSPTDWIQERTLTEARALLTSTRQTVSEITYRLGFTDTTHFGKFIRKHTGHSPTEIRRSATL